MYAKGDCTVSAGSSNDGENGVTIAWSNQAGEDNYVQDYTPSSDFGGDESLQRSNVTSTVNRLTADSEKQFFLVPQAVSSDHPVTVYIDINSSSHNQQYAVALGDVEWKAGKRYTYTLNKTSADSNYYIDDIEDIVVDYTGNVGEAKTTSVNSYRTPYQILYTKHLNWELEYSEDGTTYSSTKPDWINKISDTAQTTETFWWGIGGSNTYYKQISVQVNAQDPTDAHVGSLHTDNLRTRSEIGTEANPIDLSKVDVNGAGRSAVVTANCYVVSQPGWYCFPIVYGNAIDFQKVPEGGVNEKAYYPGVTGYNVLERFKNCYNEGITSPYILEDIKDHIDVGNVEAQFVWQDKDADPRQMIDYPSGISVVSNTGEFTDNAYCKYVKFHISKENISQGNIMLAVRDKSSKTIYWSWHIWVTDTDFTTVSANGNEIMPVHLGTCYGATGKSVQDVIRYYAKRVCYVKVKQVENGNETGKTRIFRIIQNPYYDYIENASCPFYQFGRKDPIMAADLLVAGNNHDVRNSKWETKEFYTSSEYADYIVDASDTQKQKLYRESSGTFGYAIQHPNVYFTSQAWFSNFNNQSCYNLWDYDQTGAWSGDETTNKTIYDPCPPEYCVANKSAFSFISNDSSTLECCWWDSVRDEGEKSMCVGFKVDGNTVYFNVSSKRKDSGTLDGANDAVSDNNTNCTNTTVWTASLSSTSQAYTYKYGNEGYGASVEPTYYGFCVRPIREPYIPPVANKLGKPGNLKVSDIGENSIKVSWDAVANATSYYVSWDGGSKDGVTDTYYTVTGLTAGTTYTFSVTAKASGYTSSDPATISGTTSGTAPTPTPTKLGVPGCLTVTGTTTSSVSLSWNKVDGAAGYDISYGSLTWNVGSGSTTSATVTGLDADTSYSFKIKAKADDSGSYEDSDWSSAVTGKTGAIVWTYKVDAVSPTGTSNISAGGSVTLSFKSYKTADGQTSQAAPWKLKLKIEGKDSDFSDLTGNYSSGEYAWTGTAYSGNGSTSGESVSFTFNSTASHTYTIRVVSTENESVYADFTIVQTIDKTKLATPGCLTASNATQTTIDLSWSAVEHADKYYVSWNNGANSTTVTTNSAQITGLTAGTTYTFSVTAQSNDTGTYADSDPATVNGTTQASSGGGSTFDLTGYTAGSVIPASAFASATAGMCMKIKFITTNSWSQMWMCYKDTWECIDGISGGSSDDCTYKVEGAYMKFNGYTVGSEVTISIPLTSESLSKISSTGGITIRAADNMTLKSMTIE